MIYRWYSKEEEHYDIFIDFAKYRMKMNEIMKKRNSSKNNNKAIKTWTTIYSLS